MMLDLFATVFKFKEKESPDKLGLYPERVHVAAMPERRYLWTSYALVILICFSIALNMMLALSLYVMIPMRGSRPQLYTVNKYFSQIDPVQPAEMSFPLNNLVAEENITTYILSRYIITPNFDELERRWGKGSTVFWMSSPAVFNAFRETEADPNIVVFKSKKMFRNVEIDWVRALTGSFWQVQFRTLDYLPKNPEPIIGVWRANMRVAFTTFKKISPANALKNPFGFIVTEYQLSYMGNPSVSESYMSQAKKITSQMFLR
ncbi:MAG: type IV secretion system protein [Alphaproteobacteria bacterium]|nr:type IV secretion system protein [Alphaproteobacteria bacterium]